MLFLILLTFGALTLASAAIFFSVLGLVQTFSITALFWGSAIEASKLLTASFLTRFWKRIGLVTKSLGIGAVVALMIITSAGIYGHIISSYQEGAIEIETQQILLDEAQQNVDRLSERLDSIDSNIRSTEQDIEQANQTIREVVGREDAYITARTRQAATVRDDRDNLEQRLEQLLGQRESLSDRHEEYQSTFLKLRSEMLMVEAKVGPIITVMSILGDEVGERAMLWFVLLIVLVFDPVAVYLTIQANRVAMFRKEDSEMVDEGIIEDSGESPKEPEDASAITSIISGINDKLKDVVEKNEDTQSKLSQMEKSISKSEKKNQLKKDLMHD